MKEFNVRQWLDNNELSIKIFNKKYRRDNESDIQWLDRVSGGEESVKELIKAKKFAFGGRILANRGYNQTASNCFILDEVGDSIDEIMEQCRQMALTYKAGGGVGFALDRIRPKGSVISGQENTHPGMIDFMKLFSTVTGSIKGNNRRGALLLLLNALHPDIMDFINSKLDKDNGITNANISVKLTDDFMRKALNGVVETLEYIIPDTREIKKYTVDYNNIFDTLCHSSMKSAEPGIVFWDRINNYSLASEYKQYRQIGLNP